MAEQIPDRKTRAARVALAVMAGALGTALIGGALWLAFRPEPEAPKQTEIEPAEESEGSTFTLPPSAQTTAPGEGSDGQVSPEPDGSDAPTEGASAEERAAKIAFRLGASIYLANEDGSDARALVRSAAGPYALSPDGRTLAFVEASALRLVDVGTGKATRVGTAQSGLTPCWAGNSGSVVFGRRQRSASEEFEIWRVQRDGSRPQRISGGQQAALSPDGRLLVLRTAAEPMADGSSSVQVSENGGTLRPVRVPGLVTAVATSGERIFAGISRADGSVSLISFAPDGSDVKQLAGAVPGTVPAVWGQIKLSPDGQYLAAAAQGDDGWSRLFTLRAAGGEPRSLSLRKDAYLHGWSADSQQVFMIEGNAFQGEATMLVRIGRDGTGRRSIVTGAE